MANKKNWAKRNKKPNNWKAMIKKRKEKETNLNSENEEACKNYGQDKNEIQPLLAIFPESHADNEDDLYENTNISFKRRRICDREEPISESENYFECLDVDEDEHIEITSNQMTNDCDETQPNIDPLLSVDNNEHLLHENEEVDDEHADENEVEPTNENSGDDDFSNSDEDEPNLEEKIKGRRIFNMPNLFKRIKATGKHSRHCSFDDMELIGETKRGLKSTFKFVCTRCGIRRKLETCPKKKNTLDCNEDAVLGITSIGSGFYHLQEFLTNLDIPVMGNTLYDKIQKRQQKDWYALANQHTLDALYEEIELAKAIGSVDSEGNALIPVICDGGWGKRSYGKAFNSLSGCAVLIGLRTNKIVFFGVRNKYCHTCKIAQSKFTPPNYHECNKNYSGPSSGMEADIITEGFKFCNEYGARFHKLIADGDSNTYKKIRDIRIYRNPDLFVEKSECCNHLHRNFRTKFRVLSTVTRFDIDLRKHVKPSKGHDISKGVKAAAKHWRDFPDLDMNEKIENLEADIMNAPDHYFGVHHKCRNYFCNKTTSKTADDNLALLKEDGLYYEVLNLCQHHFAGHAKSLLENYTNNPAEEFNSVVAKFIGGKRINYSLGFSYAARVASAVIQYNSGGHVGSEFRKFKFSNAQCSSIEKMENSRKRKLQKNEVARKIKPRILTIAQGTETEYYHGEGSQDVDMEPSSFEKARKIFIQKLKNYQRNRYSIEESTRGGKHNSRWQQIRQDLLPSSFIPNIVQSKVKTSYKGHLEELMYKRSEFGNSAQIKHQRLVERDALDVFKTLFYEHTVEEWGLYIDKDLYYVCASPSAAQLKVYGRDHILNIKCPVKQYRKVFDNVISDLKFLTEDGNLNEKHEWYIELQCEMHISNRKYGFLMVWLGEYDRKAQYRIIIIPKDDSFFEKTVKPKIQYFYEQVMMKELVDSRKARSMELRKYNREKDSYECTASIFYFLTQNKSLSFSGISFFL